MGPFSSYSAISAVAAITTAKTLLQLTAPAGASLVILRAWASFATTTAAAGRVQISRKTVAGTGTAITEVKLQSQGPTALATAIGHLSSDGTDGDVLLQEHINVANGWLYLPVPEERIVVPPSGIIAIKSIDTISSTNAMAGIVWAEIY